MSRVLNWLGLFGLLASLVAGQESRPLTNDDVISVRKARYSPVERTLTVGPNEDVVLPLTLRPSPER
jgi:hypothetical protein